MHLGTTFDYEHAIQLGLNWKKALDQIIDLNLSPIRIGIKWSRVECQKNKYDWEIYDYIFERLNKKNVETLLCIGIKSPRWPEFFIPEWFTKNNLIAPNSLITNNYNKLLSFLFSFIKEALKRYTKLSNIKWLQVENEPFFPFGPHKWHISKAFLASEIKYVRSLTNLPIILTSQGLPTTGLLAEYIKGRNKRKKEIIPMGDVIGFNVFPKFEGKLFGIKPHIFKASKGSWNYLKRTIELSKQANRDTWITELQAEPWEANPSTKNINENKTCSPKLVAKYVKKAEASNVSTTLLWGIEFQLLCYKEGNKRWINTTENLLKM